MITQIIKNTTVLFFLLISNLEAGQGTCIVEPFSCELELLNEEAVTKRMEYINSVDTNRSMYHEYKELFKVHDLIIESLVMNECEVK